MFQNIPTQERKSLILLVLEDSTSQVPIQIISATDVPGPGIYQPQNDLSNEGKYVLSKNVSAGKRTFMDGRRLSFTEIVAKRSGSKNNFIKPLGQVATAHLLTLDTTIAEEIEK